MFRVSRINSNLLASFHISNWLPFPDFPPQLQSLRDSPAQRCMLGSRGNEGKAEVQWTVSSRLRALGPQASAGFRFPSNGFIPRDCKPC